MNIYHLNPVDYRFVCKELAVIKIYIFDWILLNLVHEQIVHLVSFYQNPLQYEKNHQGSNLGGHNFVD